MKRKQYSVGAKVGNIKQGECDRKDTSIQNLCPKRIDAEDIMEKNSAAGQVGLQAHRRELTGNATTTSGVFIELMNKII
jgi:hypothetical protein